MTLHRLFRAGLFVGLLAAAAQEKADDSSPVLKEFQRRVSDYVKLHKTAKSEVHPIKITDSAQAIEQYEHRLAARIRTSWPPAAHGIFTADGAVEFRRLIAIAMKGPEGRRILESLQRAAPVRLPAIRVDDAYPSAVPLQSTPPSLLLNLPALPPEVEYRVVGNDLVLRDIDANLIVDFIPNVIV